MDDSEESELVFVVPSSMDDSKCSDAALEDPLGLSTESKTSPGGVEAESSMFSCFQLSGVTQDHASESLHIGEDHSDIIPSSPNVMHIALSGSPSLKQDSPARQTTALSAQVDGLDSENEKDFGRMSPDMMASGDTGYNNDKSPDTKCNSAMVGGEKTESISVELGKAATKNNGMDTTNSASCSVTDQFGCGNSNANDSCSSDPYSAETLSYSEAYPTSELGIEASCSMSYYLPKSTVKDSDSGPVFVTATSEADSEKQNPSSSCAYPIPFESISSETDSKTGPSIVVKDDDNSKDQKEEDNVSQDIESQEFSQEGLDLCLTIESQLSVGLSFSATESDAVVAKDDVISNDSPQRNCNDAENGTSSDISNHRISNKDNESIPLPSETIQKSKNELGNESSNIEDGSVPLPNETIQKGQNESTNESSNKEDGSVPLSNETIQKSQNESGNELGKVQCSQLGENDSGFSVDCSRGTLFASEDSFAAFQKPRTDTNVPRETQQSATDDNPEVLLQESHTTEAISRNNASDCDESASNTGNNCDEMMDETPASSVPQRENADAESRQLMIYDDDSKDDKESHDVNLPEIKDGDSDRNLAQSNGDDLSTVDKDSASVQSTYVNETNNSLLVDPTHKSWIDDESSPKDLLDSIYIDSNDVTMEDSILEKDVIGELETQPFSPQSKSGPKTTSQNSVSQPKNNITQAVSEVTNFNVDTTVRDILTEIITCVTTKRGRKEDKRSGSDIILDKFAAKSSLPGNKGKKHRISNLIGGDNESSPKESPNKTEYVYRVIRSEIVETILNGEVVATKVLPKKVKLYNVRPPVLSKSSSGSGYLADTSSLSRSSSNCSTKTNVYSSPASSGPEKSLSLDSFPRNDLVATNVSSSDSSQPGNFQDSGASETAVTAKSKLCGPTRSPRRSAGALHSPQSNGTSPMVVLTPLSTQLIAQHAVEGKRRSDVATPPVYDINPPISGSTPVDSVQESDMSSDVHVSNSPEIAYPGDVMDTSATPVECCSHSLPTPPSPVLEGPETSSQSTQGVPVIARYPGEVYFYPGTMHPQNPVAGKYTVIFDDDRRKKKIKESDVLLIEKLDVGQEVYVQLDDLEYCRGKILSCGEVDGESGYTVEVDSDSDSETSQKTTKTFLRKQVIIKISSLTKEQRRSLVQPLSVVSSSDVSLDNIVDGKRKARRSSRSIEGSKRSLSPSTSKTPRSSRKRRLNPSPSVPTSHTKRTKLLYAKYLFRGCCFLLTSSSGQHNPYEFDSDASLSTSGYDRGDVQRIIKTCSGQVVKDFAKLMDSDCEQLYVISNGHCRTISFLSALAAGLQCVSFKWILDSSRMQSLQPVANYFLPAGYSLQQERIVERLNIRIRPLQQLRVYMVLKDKKLYKTLLNLAGCDVMDSVSDDSPLGCDVAIADSSTILELREGTLDLEVPIVTVEWAIQCLINSEKLPVYSHPQYTNFS